MTGTGKGRSEPPGCLNRSIMVRPLVTEIAAVERRGAQPPSVIGRHARFAKRANHISALSGAPLPLCPKGAKEEK